MDDHVGKPFQRDVLHAVVARWSPLPIGGQASPATDNAADACIVDRAIYEGFLSDVGPTAMASLLGKLQRDLSERLAGVASRAAMLDRQTLAREAHSTIGSTGTLGFVALSQACRELEAACGADEHVLLSSLTRVVTTQTATTAAITGLLEELSDAA